jgi:hypothetical protein
MGLHQSQTQVRLAWRRFLFFQNRAEAKHALQVCDSFLHLIKDMKSLSDIT